MICNPHSNVVFKPPIHIYGGYYNQSQGLGPFYIYCSNEPVLDSNVGCRLQERPPKTV